MFEVFAATAEDMGPGDIGHHASRAEAMVFDGLQVPNAIHDELLLSALALNVCIANSQLSNGIRMPPSSKDITFGESPTVTHSLC